MRTVGGRVGTCAGTTWGDGSPVLPEAEALPEPDAELSATVVDVSAGIGAGAHMPEVSDEDEEPGAGCPSSPHAGARATAHRANARAR